MNPNALPTDPVLRCWFRQSRTEYMAAAFTSEMTHWLIQIGVPPELLHRATQVVSDEVRHSELCHELYLHAGGQPRQVPVKVGMLRHGDDLGAPIHLRAITAAGELACEESVALPVFRKRYDNATDPTAARIVGTILRDEASHRAFAWDLLAALIDMYGLGTVRDWARPRIAWWLRIYIRARLEDAPQAYTEAQIGMGLIQRREHWALMKACVATDVIPRFQKLGLLEPETDMATLEAEWRARTTSRSR